MLGYMLAGGLKGAGDAFIKLGAEARERARKLEDEQRKEAALDRQTRRNSSQMREVLGLGDAPEAKDPSFPLSQNKGLSFGSNVPSMNRGTASGEKLSFGEAAKNFDGNGAIRSGIIDAADALGVDPVDLATVISYETAGTFDPQKAGPTTQWGQHRGFLQFGEPQAKQHKVNWNDPVNSQLGRDGAVVSYLASAGVKPGMGLLDIYSAVNAGAPGLYDRTDENNGGAPGTVRDKVQTQMAGHREKALELLQGSSGKMDGAAYDRLPLSMGDGVSIAPPERQQMVANAEIDRLIEIASDERASSMVRTAAANRINEIRKGQANVSEKLTGEEWVQDPQNPDQEILMGRNDRGQYAPYTQRDTGQPIVRSSRDTGKTRGSDWSLDTSEINQIEDFVESDRALWTEAPSAREMAAEVQRLMKADDTLTLIDAYSVAANAWQGVEVTETVTEKDWFGRPTEVTNTRQDFDFRYGSEPAATGLGDAPSTATPEPEEAPGPSTGGRGRADRRDGQNEVPDALKMPSDPSQLENGRIYLHPQTGQAIRWNAETKKFEVL